MHAIALGDHRTSGIIDQFAKSYLILFWLLISVMDSQNGSNKKSKPPTEFDAIWYISVPEQKIKKVHQRAKTSLFGKEDESSQ